jgi:predicted TIM-barrel fold metal-dependent hydrolase
VVQLMGDDRVIFGSDWPHIEGLRSPRDYLVELKPFDDSARARIARGNAAELTGLRPVQPVS